MQVRVEVALPVVPQAPGIVLEPGADHASTLERSECLAAVKTRGVVDKGQQFVRHAQVLHDGPPKPPQRGQRQQALGDVARNEAKQGGIDEQAHFGGVGGAAEDLQHLAHAVTHRVYQVVTPVIGVTAVADHIQRAHHKVHRHNIDAPTLQADRGQPGRQPLTQALDQLEKIVGAIHLVHLAGLAVAHHHGRAVHRPG